jgi:hypothetical protein
MFLLVLKSNYSFHCHFAAALVVFDILLLKLSFNVLHEQTLADWMNPGASFQL